jgi:hypothetical protein
MPIKVSQSTKRQTNGRLRCSYHIEQLGDIDLHIAIDSRGGNHLNEAMRHFADEVEFVGF